MPIFDARHKPISLDLPPYTEAARQFKPSAPDTQDAHALATGPKGER